MRKSRGRLIALILAVFLTVMLCSVRLVHFQVVEGENYLNAANRTSMSEVSVNAARGAIYDRNGVPLVVNEACFNLVFERAFMKDGDENRVISGLIYLMKEEGEDWEDPLPISKEAPYTFLKNSSEAIERMRKKLKVQSFATAEDCMNEMIELFDLEGYSGVSQRELMGVRYGMLINDFSIYNSYVFAEDVRTETVTRIKELSDILQGVDVAADYVRNYAGADTIPHIIGSLSAIYPEEVEDYLAKGYSLNDKIGRSGIEGAFEDVLRGTSGEILVEQDRYGNVVSTTTTVSPIAGNSIMLTIDMEFQQQVQQILGDFIQKLVRENGRGRNAKAGAIVVLDPKNGDVLAAATYPTYQLTDLKDAEKNALLQEDPNNPWTNRAFWEIYRPGSTFKTITATGALMEGVITPADTVNCSGTYWYDSSVNGYHPTCTGVHGNIAVSLAVTKSCNIFFYDVGRRLGIDRIDHYAELFGLGTDTGLEIRNAKGQVASPALSEDNGEEWYPGNTWQAAIGQSDTKITPLQMALQAMTIANDGIRYKAHLLKSVNSYDLGETIEEIEPTIMMDELSKKSSFFDAVKTGMRGAADSRASMVGIEGGVAIKTGTPQVTKTLTNTTVLGYYPATGEPEICFSAVIEGGEYSADMMAEVIRAYQELKTTREQGTN